MDDHRSYEAQALPWDAQDALARRATLTRLLGRISREALQGEGLHQILQGICDCLVAELPVPIASVIVLNEQTSQFVDEVWAGELILESQANAIGWPVTYGAAGRCARLGTTQLIVDVDADPDYVSGHPDVRSEYLVPIRHRQRLHGVLNIESTRTDFFDAESCAVFDAVADLVAGAIHFARIAEELTVANRKLEQLSMIDGLTGIANRRCFDQHLREEWMRMAAESRPLTLAMADADAFKALNDSHGHLHGDDCLRELARIFQRFATGERDLVARFGGEELALLMPGRDREEALDIAECLRAAVEAAAMPHPTSPVAPFVTMSIGVASLQASPTRPAEVLVAAADRALYAAKQRGRNQVCALPADSVVQPA